MYLGFFVKKENGVISFREIRGVESRNKSTQWAIIEADKYYNWPDFIEIEVNTSDTELSNNLSYSRTDGNYNKIIPDFNFKGWPEVGINNYDETIREIEENGLNPAETNKIGWIGNEGTHPNRRKLVNIGNNNREKMEIIPMSWEWKGAGIMNNYNKFLSLPELVKKYSILIDIEGYGYSGRLKYLLFSNRPVLIVDRPHKEYFFEHLKPYVHYIPVERELSDLLEKVEWCLNNENEAKRIAENAYIFSKKYLTREACFEQWNKVISQFIKDN